jgi:DNA-binding transcriptional ArsR family regulator
MDIAEKAKLYGALADPLRLRIVSHLMAQGEACGKELASSLAMSVALVSHHTKILEDAGLVSRRREGQFVRFTLNRERLAALEISDSFPSSCD